MKKLVYVFLFISLFSLIGCNTIEYMNYNKKPNQTYYSDKLKNSLNSNIQNIKIIENNFFKEINLDENQVKLISEMINEIDSTDVLTDKISIESEKSLFKIYVETKSENFIIDVYGNDVLTIYPWDGIYEKDIVSLSQSPLSLKPESICKYIFKN